MKQYKFLFPVLLLTVITGCKKLADFQTSPNNPTEADPALNLTAIEINAFSTISGDAALASRYLVYTQGSSNAQYYGWQRQGSMGYANVTQTIKMEQEAEKVSKKNYRYLGKFFRSSYIISMTQTFGDIPYSGMMKAILENDVTSAESIRPVYDKQKDIYISVLNELKIASDSLSAQEAALNGDIIYNGNVDKWRRLINSFTLRVLMSLSKKEADGDLNIQQRFNEIVSNPAKYPLLASNDDNGKLGYYEITGNQYPFFNNNSMKTDYYLDSSFVDILKNNNDPRLFVFGKPMPSSPLPADDVNAYDGLKGSASLAYNTGKRGAGNASQINDRYSYHATNEPSVLMSYAELQFLLAEAVVRGWISGDAENFYKEGIKASLNFSNFNNTYSQADIDNFLNQPSLSLQNGAEIEQIITQKYVSMFMNTGWLPFYEQRRTGFPAFDVDGGGILNNGRIPKRWMYPNAEYENNGANVESAVSSQFSEGDNVNAVMWILQ